MTGVPGAGIHPMQPLPPHSIVEGLARLPHWSEESGQLVRTFEFPRFEDAIRFVTETARIAIEMDHHPDIQIRSCRVTIGSTTHDAGGLTALDFELAARCDALVR